MLPVIALDYPFIDANIPKIHSKSIHSMKIYRLAVDENGSPFVLNSKRISDRASLLLQRFGRVGACGAEGLPEDGSCGDE